MVIVCPKFNIFEGFQASWDYAISKHVNTKMQIFA